MNEDAGYDFLVLIGYGRFLILEYESTFMSAPVCLDVGAIADNPIRMSIRNERDVAFDDAFYRVVAKQSILTESWSPGQEIPPHLYELVAELFAWKNRKYRRNRVDGT